MFVFVNYRGSNDVWIAPYHGKSVLLKSGHPIAPIPSLFLFHEQRVRRAFPHIKAFIPTQVQPQMWITNFEEAISSDIERKSLVTSDLHLPLTRQVIDEIFSATKNTVTWKVLKGLPISPATVSRNLADVCWFSLYFLLICKMYVILIVRLRGGSKIAYHL